MLGTKFSGTETNRLIGGIWVVSDFEADLMGMHFEGHGVIGYDVEQDLYVSTWVQSMEARMNHSEGHWDAEKNQLVMVGEGRDMMNQPVTEKNVITFTGEDTMTAEVFHGDELFLTIDYTRAD